MLDPLTAFIFATIYSVLSGAVLGFMHGALPHDLQPSAADWRIGTLLIAAGAALFVGQSLTQTTWVIPFTQGTWLLGLGLYWRAIRRYFALRDTLWIFAPAAVGSALIAVFTFIHPSLTHRINVATVCWVIPMIGVAWTLRSHRSQDDSISSKVLSGIFFSLVVLLLVHGAYFLTRSIDGIAHAAPIDLSDMLTPLMIAVLPVIGTTVFVLLCFERIRRVLHRMATTDALTGLPNRRTIGEHGAARFVRAQSLGLGFSIAVIDIDHFKRVNDQYGHATGDAVLRLVACTLVAQCRGADLVGRQGGEEFVAVFDDADGADARTAAERLRTAVAMAVHPVGAETLAVTVSIGVATFAAADPNYEALLQRADRALYAAKAAGRNCTYQAALNAAV